LATKNAKNGAPARWRGLVESSLPSVPTYVEIIHVGREIDSC
jgi:hypothetical protein